MDTDNKKYSAKTNSIAVAVWVLLAVAGLFLTRFFLYPHLVDIDLEQCHTGAMARDILDHGPRFHPFAYIPEKYENGIFIEGLAAVPFTTVFGRNVFTLKLLGFTTGALCLVLALLLLRLFAAVAISGDSGDTIRNRTDDFGHVPEILTRALLLCFLFFAAGPPFFQYMSLSALGDHNEGAMLTLLLLYLFGLWRARPSAGRVALLGCASGVVLFWEKATALPLLVCLLMMLLRWRAEGMKARDALLLAAAFLVGYAPGIAVHIARHFQDVSAIIAKFAGGGVAGGGHGPAPIVIFLKQFWLASGHNLPLCLLVVAATAWMLAEGFFGRERGTAAKDIQCATALCGVLFLAALAASARRPVPDAYQYFWVVAFPLTAWAAAGWLIRLWKSDGLSSKLRFAVVGLAVVLSLNADMRPNAARIGKLKRDTGRAACYWRFARGFQITLHVDTPGPIVHACEKFGGDRTKDCVSGIPSVIEDASVKEIPPRLRPAFAFGAGKFAKKPNVCERFHADLLSNCLTGYFAKKKIYDRLAWTILGIPPHTKYILPSSIPYDGFEKTSLTR